MSTFLAKDGVYYDSYQTMRDANIRFNEAHLKQKGLDANSFRELQRSLKGVPAATKMSSRLGYEKRKTASPHSLKPRRSSRIKNGPARPILKLPMLPERPSKSMARRRQKNTSVEAVAPLSAEERNSLKNLPAWTEDMSSYLLAEENLSQKNLGSVMRQVEKLVSGVGITYSRWGGVYFYQNKQIDLTFDFDSLYDEAVEFENEHGRDLGNGWLLRHPIKKMANFQRYQLERLGKENEN